MKKLVCLLLVLLLLFCATTLPLYASDEETTASEPVAVENMKIDALSAVLMEAETGTVLFSQNPDESLPPASVTKIMTLLLVMEAIESGRISLDDKVSISENAASMGGSQVFLEAGNPYKAGELIKSVIVSSANDSSVCLAERLFGSESEAVDKMNERAREWGLEDTLFSNVTGLPKPTQYSCAKDVAIMLDKLISHEDYFRYSSIYLDELAHAGGNATMMTNTNKLVRFYQGCDGGKTGFTKDAGFCLAATAKRGAMRVIGVVIGESDSKQRFADVSALFDHAFNNYSRKILFDKDELLEEKIKIRCAFKDLADLKVAKDVYSFTKKGDKSEFTFSIDIKDSIVAPFKCGEVVGKVTVYKDGAEYRSEDVVVAEDIRKMNAFDGLRKIADRW